MQPLVIDAEELINAMEMQDEGGRYYLDRETGRLHLVIADEIGVVGVLDAAETGADQALDYTLDRFLQVVFYRFDTSLRERI